MKQLQARPPQWSNPLIVPRLVDRFGRTIEYLRVSVTDRCDLRCTYCIPKGFKSFEDSDHWLTGCELERVIGIFAALGLKRVRLTGGEPLLRKDIEVLVARLAAIPGIEDLSLSTNATRLISQALPLRKAGITRLNVSLDSLDPVRFAYITGRDLLPRVLEGLTAAKQAGFASIKINMVALRDTTEREIDNMVAYCIEEGFVLRFIETMPMGESGRSVASLDLRPVYRRLRERLDLVAGIFPGGGPARYLKARDGSFSIGFISPISQHFCTTCNRLRLSVDGMLYMCLGQNESVALRPMLRGGASDTEITRAILQAIELKPERHEFRESPGKVVRIMAKTGG